jgi:hypothetical protein
MPVLVLKLLKSLFLSLAVEVVVKKLVILGLKAAAKSTSNKLDDEAVKIVVDAWEKSENK